MSKEELRSIVIKEALDNLLPVLTALHNDETTNLDPAELRESLRETLLHFDKKIFIDAIINASIIDLQAIRCNVVRLCGMILAAILS